MMIEGIVGPAITADTHYDNYAMLLSIHQLIDSYISGKKFKKQNLPEMNEMFPWMGALRPALKQDKMAKKAFRLLKSLRTKKEKEKEKNAGTS